MVRKPITRASGINPSATITTPVSNILPSAYMTSLFSPADRKHKKKKKKSYFISLCDGLLLIHSCVKKSVIIISFLREGGCCVHPLENYVIHFSTKGKKDVKKHNLSAEFKVENALLACFTYFLHVHSRKGRKTG